jgi:predicted RNA-binding Zn-ribbon protein involved in translation (DUF1610 family)
VCKSEKLINILVGFHVVEGSMMKQNMTQQANAYKIDLSETGRDGAFLCPKCGASISPDDHSDAVYSIYDTS